MTYGYTLMSSAIEEETLGILISNSADLLINEVCMSGMDGY